MTIFLTDTSLSCNQFAEAWHALHVVQLCNHGRFHDDHECFLEHLFEYPTLSYFCSKPDLSWLNYLEYCQTYESVLNSHHLLSEQTNVFFRFIWVIKIRARFKKHNWSDTNDELEVRSEKYIAMFLDLLIQIKFWLSFP